MRESQPMTPTEAAAYAKGIRDAREMAMIAAVTIEARDDHRDLRQQAAAAALLGLAAGLQNLLPANPNPLIAIMATLPTEPGSSGTVECPHCKGSLRWMRDSSNGHLHMQCETAGCLRVMQ